METNMNPKTVNTVDPYGMPATVILPPNDPSALSNIVAKGDTSTANNLTYTIKSPWVASPQPAKKEFAFHEPELRIDDWDLDPVNPNDNTMLINTVDFPKEHLEDIYTKMDVPVIVFTSKCWQEIRYLTTKYPHREWAVFLTMKKLDNMRPHFLAFDWFMPGQRASSGEVSLDTEDCIKYFDRVEEKYPYYKENGLHKFLCHLHSHHSLNMPSFSSVDDTQQFTRGELGFFDKYRFYIVVTCNSGVKASLVLYEPVLSRVNAALAITWSRPEYVEELTKARMKEIDAIADAAIFTPAPAPAPVTGARYNYGSAYNTKGPGIWDRGTGTGAGWVSHASADDEYDEYEDELYDDRDDYRDDPGYSDYLYCERPWLLKRRAKGSKAISRKKKK